MPQLPDTLELVAHAVTAVLATWLGLIVLTRARGRTGATLFTILAGYLAVWSAAILIERLTSVPATVNRPLRAVEDVAAFLLPAGTLHISVYMAEEGRHARASRAVVIGTYLISGLIALGAVIAPDQKLQVTAPHLSAFGIPAAVLGWAWIAFRIAVFGAAVAWIAVALRSAASDRARRRQLVAILVAVLLGATGGILRFLPGPADSDPWIGVSLVTLAVVVAAYAVFAQGVFLSAEVAGQAFRYSVLAGLGVTAYVVGLVSLERGAEALFHIQLPIVMGLALVVTIALFEPVSAFARRTLGPASPRQRGYERLLQALGQDLLTAQRPEATIGPALARLDRTFRLEGAVVRGRSDEEVARHGNPSPDSSLALTLTLATTDAAEGTVTFGPKRSRLPFTPHEVELLRLAAGYLAASLRLGARHTAQTEELETLSAEHRAVVVRGHDLSRALDEARGHSPALQLFVLGPMHAERNGALIRQWGGAKAGSRQAEGIFAFLFDRGDLGVAKDEILELIWPDVDLERADLAFHRTMGGLRTTLEPGRRGGNRGSAIAFSNDRYRLNSELIGWTDLDAFGEHLSAAAGATDPADVLPHLEQARALYRGDYLDDCPFYGDSVHVEDRRALLRGRLVDLLLALGEQYEARGDVSGAAASFREARSAALERLPRADEALARLGFAV